LNRSEQKIFDNVYQDYLFYTCNNTGQENSYCSNYTDKPKVKDFAISCFYDSDILCRFYALGVLRAWNNIKSDPKRDWKNLFKEIAKKQNLKDYLEKMKQKLQLQVSKKLLQSKEEEYLFSHELLGKILFE
jgi:hypothetical protein